MRKFKCATICVRKLNLASDECVRSRLPALEGGTHLKETARAEADGLVKLAELLTLLRLRTEGADRNAVTSKRP
jgi:hypothetical protein